MTPSGLTGWSRILQLQLTLTQWLQFCTGGRQTEGLSASVCFTSAQRCDDLWVFFGYQQRQSSTLSTNNKHQLGEPSTIINGINLTDQSPINQHLNPSYRTPRHFSHSPTHSAGATALLTASGANAHGGPQAKAAKRLRNQWITCNKQLYMKMHCNTGLKNIT